MTVAQVHIDGGDPIELKLGRKKYTSATLLAAVSKKLGQEMTWAGSAPVPLKQVHSDSGACDLYVTSASFSAAPAVENTVAMDVDVGAGAGVDTEVRAAASVTLDGDIASARLSVPDEVPRVSAAPMASAPVAEANYTTWW